jgi:hypothetical protein
VVSKKRRIYRNLIVRKDLFATNVNAIKIIKFATVIEEGHQPAVGGQIAHMPRINELRLLLGSQDHGTALHL